MKASGITSLLLALGLVLVGCGSGSVASSNMAADASYPSTASSNSAVHAERAAPMTTAGSAANTSAQSVARKRAAKAAVQNITLKQSTTAQIDTAPADRKVIRNAEIAIEAEEPEESQRKISAIAEDSGGFVVESQQSSIDSKATRRDTINMTLRVPAAKFASALASIRESGTRVVSENLKGDDVTEEFIDVEARLKAQKVLEAQFAEIMKRAYSVDDALSVQRELADVRGEIEKIEGRKRFLENQSELSTIRVKVQTQTAIAASTVGFSGRLAAAFGSGLDVAVNFVLGLLTFVIAVLPFLLFIGLPVFLVVRYLVRRNRMRPEMEVAKE